MALGFGQYAFGSAGFGYAPVITAESRRPRAPAAWRYEGLPSDWSIGDDDRPRSVHNVDQGMAFSILFERGTIASDKRIGHDLLTLDLDGSERDAGLVDACVRNSWPCRQYLADKRVTILRIDHELVEHGGLKVVVYYRNHDLPDEQRVVYES